MSLLRDQGNGAGGEATLCLTCAYSQVVQGYLQSQQVIVCRGVYPPWRVPFAVQKCTAHTERCAPHLEEMQQIAHVLVRGQRGKQVGFVTPDQYREMETDDEG